MRPKILLRIASFCMLFFAVGHTVGHLTRHDVQDPKAKEVQGMMINNKFDMFGSMRSYDENYTGMSYNLIFILLAFTIILWILSNVKEDKKMVIALLIPIACCVLGFAITGFLYFFIVPAITCLLAFLLIIFTIVRLKYKAL